MKLRNMITLYVYIFNATMIFTQNNIFDRNGLFFHTNSTESMKSSEFSFHSTRKVLSD